MGVLSIFLNSDLCVLREARWTGLLLFLALARSHALSVEHVLRPGSHVISVEHVLRPGSHVISVEHVLRPGSHVILYYIIFYYIIFILLYFISMI